MKLNPILAIDMYKAGHVLQYPQGTQYVYSNFTPRSSKLASKISGIFDEKVVSFGLQGFIKWYLIDTFNEGFFNRPKQEVVDEYQWHMDQALSPGVDVSHIAALHDLGYLPICIKALPEGSRVNIKVPLFTVINTHPDFFWLTNYLEDVLSNESWKAVTTATTAYQYRKLLEQYAEKTGANKDFILWQGHDFSFRGVGGIHDGAKNSSGHLLSFLGTDTIPAICYLKDYYNGASTYIGGSVPASEHSVMTIKGPENEFDCIKRLITEVYPTGVVSVVADGYDYWNVITNTAVQLKEDILARKENALGLAKVVFRPDSGDPADIVCGCLGNVRDYTTTCSDVQNAAYWLKDELVEDEQESAGHGECGNYEVSGIMKFQDKFYEVKVEIEWNRYDKQYYYVDGSSVASVEEVQLSSQQKGSIECLWDIFGGTVNEKGYKELNPRVGLIYGDSITLARAQDILARLEAKGFASSNIVFGIGSYTYQYQTRDSYGFACKATWGVVDGVARDIYKSPKTGDGTKNSARGLLRVEKEGDNYVLYDQQTREQEQQGELKTIFENGVLVRETSLAEVRERLHGK